MGTSKTEQVPEVLVWAAKRLAWERNLDVLRAEAAAAVVDSATAEVSQPARARRGRRFATRPEPATEA